MNTSRYHQLSSKLQHYQTHHNNLVRKIVSLTIFSRRIRIRPPLPNGPCISNPVHVFSRIRRLSQGWRQSLPLFHSHPSPAHLCLGQTTINRTINLDTCIINVPVSGTSIGRIIFFIYSILVSSGLRPPCIHNIFSSIIAATGRQLKQSVNVFHNFILNLLLHSS